MRSLFSYIACRVTHSGEQVEHEITTSPGVTASRMVARTCLTCGRSLEKVAR